MTNLQIALAAGSGLGAVLVSSTTLPTVFLTAGFIVLASTLSAMRIVPIEGVALLLGVDRFMSEARAIVNVIGNGVATVVIAKSEGAFDTRREAAALAGEEDERAAA